MARPLIGMVGLLLAACCPAPVKPIIPAPVVIEVERLVVQPVDADLLHEQPETHGTLSECPSVASERLASLRQCNGQIRAISRMGQGHDE